MAAKNRVLRSIETPDGGRCVDIFVRPDRSVEFEEYRRDVEDTQGWFPIGHHAERTYKSEEAAFEAAKAAVPWLEDIARPDQS